MPKGSGLTFDHKKLKKICNDYVDLQDVGDTIDVVDFTKYLSTKPLSDYGRKPMRELTSNKVTNWQNLINSKAYFVRIIRQFDNVEHILVDGKKILVKVNEDKQLECWVCEENFDVRAKGERWRRMNVITCSKECATTYTDLVYNKD